MSIVGFPSTSVRTRQTKVPRCSPWLTPLVYFLGERIVLPLYFRRIRVRGQENVPLTGPVILAPTHRARWDSIVLPLAVGRPATGRDLHFMVTSDEVTGIQGWFIRRLGGFAVNVKSPSVSSLRHGIEILRRGEMMVIYPEGGIFRDQQIHRLKPGLARLALQAESSVSLDIQVLPISIRYDSPYPHWRSAAEIVVGKPLSVSSYLESSPHQPLLSDQTKQAARALTEDLTSSLVELSETQFFAM